VDHILPLTPNPGGTLQPDQVLGRDAVIARYWQVLESRGIVLLAPRRLGKTSVCKSMVSSPPAGVVARYRDLEGRAGGPLEFTRVVYEMAVDLLPQKRKNLVEAHKWLERVGGSVHTAWVNLRLGDQDWRNLLDHIFDDVEAWAASEQKRVVLMWDEVTLFLHDLAAPGPAEAREAMVLLDRLRAARQRCPNLRMVYTGSIGLDEVIRGLRRQGYANDPVNDMASEVLPLLDPDDAIGLARHLIASFERNAGSRDSLATHVATICEGHPFLVQHVADQLKVGGARSNHGADLALTQLMEAAGDPLELGHYLDRLCTYFDPQQLDLARKVLDVLAPSGAALDIDTLAAKADIGDREALIEVLRVLRRDLYLERNAGRWSFRLAFLARYWVLERGL
jgi:hypothetical protein